MAAITGYDRLYVLGAPNYTKSVTAYQIDSIIIILLIIFALLVRAPIAFERRIMPAGDAFNFQHIAKNLGYLSYPPHEKRLPMYGILILISRLFPIEYIPMSVIISLTASAISVGTLYALGRRLKIYRAALLLFLGLSLFDPLLMLNAIRPLADSTFVFFMVLTVYCVTIVILKPKSSRRQLFWLGVVTTCLIFTRYEGLIVASLLWPLLWIRLSWRQVLRASVIPVAAIIAWIPAHLAIHGSITNLPYVADAISADGGFGEIKQIPINGLLMLNGAGFSKAWSIPNFEISQNPQSGAANRILLSTTWWLSILAILGVPWIIIRNGKAGLPIIIAGTGYTLLLSWWWVYSRYVAPLSAVYYFTAAAGFSALLSGTYRLYIQSKSWIWPKALAVTLLTAAIWIVSSESQTLMRQATGRAWEENYRGYALYRSIVSLAHESKPVALTTDQAVATLYFGTIESGTELGNQQLGFYLNTYPAADPEDLIDLLRQYKIVYLIETPDDPRILEIVRRLTVDNTIVKTEVKKERVWDTGVLEIVPVHTLRWL